jgi:hypothetical protein
MNTDRIYIGNQIGNASGLDELFRTVQDWRELLAAVRAGREEFAQTLRDSGLLQRYGQFTSAVHENAGIEVHAFILGIVSAPRWEEVQTKSYLTYASHWIDDFFDSPDRVENPARLMADRTDIHRVLVNMGRVGEVGFAMADRVAHPGGVFKSLHRMLYGGLVQRCRDYDQRHALVGEYQEVATRHLQSDLVKSIKQLQPEAYWTTNKTVLELLASAETALDFNNSEWWNLVYAPALYYEDAEAEEACGELSFSPHEAPRLAEMIEMVRLGIRYLSAMGKDNTAYLRQLEFATASIPNIPGQILTEYQSFYSGANSASQQE